MQKHLSKTKNLQCLDSSSCSWTSAAWGYQPWPRPCPAVVPPVTDCRSSFETLLCSALPWPPTQTMQLEITMQQNFQRSSQTGSYGTVSCGASCWHVSARPAGPAGTQKSTGCQSSLKQSLYFWFYTVKHLLFKLAYKSN